MNDYKIGGCSLCMRTDGESLISGTYMERFRIEEIQMNEEEGLEISLHCCDTIREKGKQYQSRQWIFTEEGKTKVFNQPYLNTQLGICYTPSDWKNQKVQVDVPLEFQQMETFTIPRLLDFIGIHSAFLYRGKTLLHASFIRTEKGAILFTAPSGTGKSTQAQLWERYQGAEIINGDRVLLGKENGKWMAYGVPFCGSSGICKNQTVPILGIVVLEQSLENRVQELSPAECFRALLGGTMYHRWSEEERQLVMELTMKQSREISMVRLSCRPDAESVNVLKEYWSKK